MGADVAPSKDLWTSANLADPISMTPRPAPDRLGHGALLTVDAHRADCHSGRLSAICVACQACVRMISKGMHHGPSQHVLRKLSFPAKVPLHVLIG